MSNKYTYKLSVLEGTKDYVIKELLKKFPGVKVTSHTEYDVTFESEISELEIFRNLYSPTHIAGNGKIFNLSNRGWRRSFVSAGINPSLAYVMCMVGDLKESDIVYDPFCGSSVLPITALKYFNVKRVVCSDISGGAITKSESNFKDAEIDVSKYRLIRSDVCKMRLSKQNADKILSNLPFGIRVGSHESNVEAYTGLEVFARKILRKKGKIVLLTQEKVLLREVFKKSTWKIKSIMRVNEGGLLPEVFEISRV